MISPEEYTVLASSDVFQKLIKGAEAALLNYVHERDTERTIQSGCRAHDQRVGGEVVLNYLTTRPTTADVARLKKIEDANEVDYDG